jgi:hypothetical protein
MNFSYYHIKRFVLAFNSWIFWLKIPSHEIPKRHWHQKFGEEYGDKWPKHHHWSYHKSGKKIAENFWQIINDGSYEMYDEYEMYEEQETTQ